MFKSEQKVTKVEQEIAHTNLSIETGKIGNQSNGAVVVQYGETVVIVSACSSKDSQANIGFFPLTVEYREQRYAAGKIPGGFFKREGRPQTKEIISARLTDRSIRPLFPKDFFNRVQIHIIVVSFDQNNDPDILGITGASAALSISDIPFEGPIAGVRVGRIDDAFVLNPSVEEREKSELDLVITGNGDDIIMVEGHSLETDEATLTAAMEFAMPYLQQQVDLQKELLKDVNKPKFEYEPWKVEDELYEKIEQLTREKINNFIRSDNKKERSDKLYDLYMETLQSLEPEFPDSAQMIKETIESIRRDELRKMTISEQKRIDGRGFDEVRPLDMEIAVAPRAHGSGLFRRGETQALAVLTFGSKLDEQKIENLEGESWKSFLVHYNFHPFSVGETSRIMGPGRREVGHGVLAERALQPVIPNEELFPYTIRIVSDIVESNGSSSMATVCAGSLALMDAAVPVKNAVAGIAMGLIVEGDEAIVLTDILGDEDHCGDMDFKVAGTRQGINAFQMDIKKKGIGFDIISKALEKAKQARLSILDQMNEVISEPRKEMSSYAPRIKTVNINPKMIGKVIGRGGEVIQKLQEDTNSDINIDDDGLITICADNRESLDEVLRRIGEITAEPEVGKVYNGTVKKITSFGAFVEFLPGQEGLLHISEIDNNYVKDVNTVLALGDEIRVKILKVDNEGKVSLSKKAVED